MAYKNWWKLRSFSGIWAAFLREFYSRDDHILKNINVSNSSRIWKWIGSVAYEVEKHIFWSLGEGKIHILLDNLARFGNLCDRVPNLPNGYMLDFWNENQWDIDALSSFLLPEYIESLKQMEVNSQLKDVPIYKLSTNSNFNFAITYKNLDDLNSIDGSDIIWNHIFSTSVSPSIKIFIWRLRHRWLPLDESMMERGISIVSQCRYRLNIKSYSCTFLSCIFARNVWTFYGRLCGINVSSMLNIEQMLDGWGLDRNSSQRIKPVICCLILWNLWKCRNMYKHENLSLRSERIISNINDLLKNQLLAFEYHHEVELQPLFDNLQTRCFKHVRIKNETPRNIIECHPEEIKVTLELLRYGTKFIAAGIFLDSKVNCLRAFSLPLNISSFNLVAAYAVLISLDLCEADNYRVIVLEVPTPELLNWILGRSMPPFDCFDHFRMICNRLKSFSCRAGLAPTDGYPALRSLITSGLFSCSLESGDFRPP